MNQPSKLTSLMYNFVDDLIKSTKILFIASFTLASASIVGAFELSKIAQSSNLEYIKNKSIIEINIKRSITDEEFKVLNCEATKPYYTNCVIAKQLKRDKDESFKFAGYISSFIPDKEKQTNLWPLILFMLSVFSYILSLFSRTENEGKSK